ncbi:MAG: peptidase [Gemmatimonadetes bacterium]|nr:peptidase [Gemmatimonadota bacterium]
MKNILRTVCVATLVAGPLTAAGAQQSAVGEWTGVLTTPSGALALVIRIRANTDGSYSGDLESLDQAAGQRIPFTTVTAAANKLAFTIAAIGASYEGEWKDSEQTWSGVFRQGMAIPLLLKRGAPPALKSIVGLDGTWRAILRRDTMNLRLILYVRTTARGTGATLDSPDLGAFGLAVQQFDRIGDTVQFRVPDAQVEFRSTLRYENRTLEGQWSRQGQPGTQVTFTRDPRATGARTRTQEPVVAKGYRAEDVSFVNPNDASVRLAGTLTVPEGRGPFPAVILITGSGPQDRNESLFGHKPFAVLADHLSRNGIAVLRYDDRGVASSSGNHAKATSADFATDANSAFRFLADRDDIKRNAIGFMGHSEGGMIGPIAAASNDRVAFLVLLAGPGTNAVQLLLSQRRLVARSQGASDEMLDRSEPIVRDILHAVRAAPDSQAAIDAIRRALPSDRLEMLGATEAQRDAIAGVFTTTWMRYFIKYEPGPFLSRLRVPVLAINGAKDVQVSPEENLAAIRVALADNRDVTVQQLAGLNHLFQTAETGSVIEYERIAETFAPSALALITEWIRARFGR